MKVIFNSFLSHIRILCRETFQYSILHVLLNSFYLIWYTLYVHRWIYKCKVIYWAIPRQTVTSFAGLIDFYQHASSWKMNALICRPLRAEQPPSIYQYFSMAFRTKMHLFKLLWSVNFLKKLGYTTKHYQAK